MKGQEEQPYRTELGRGRSYRKTKRTKRKSKGKKEKTEISEAESSKGLEKKRRNHSYKGVRRQSGGIAGAKGEGSINKGTHPSPYKNVQKHSFGWGPKWPGRGRPRNRGAKVHAV